MDLFERTGKMAIGSRLRLLTDTITSEAMKIYEMYGIDIKPKWFPVIFTLSESGESTVTAIARAIGHSHPSVSTIIREMRASGLINEASDDSTDRRRTVVSLSPKGKETAIRLKEVGKDVEEAISKISSETRDDLWRALAQWEELLSEKSLFERVKDEKKLRDKANITIVDYTPEYQELFYRLNAQWISEHWQLEETDHEYLDNPEEHIIAKGGHILIALFKGKPVGVCALIRMGHSGYDYELAKYAVDPSARGLGIGIQLVEAAVEKAKELGAHKLFLESNTLLKPAIHIYRKLGFRELKEYHPAYARGNIQMELTL